MGKVRWRRLHLDPLLVGCFAILFAFPIAASIVAAGQPQLPGAVADVASDPARATGALRDLPAFSARSPLAHKVESASVLTDEDGMRGALSAALDDVLGDPAGGEVLRLVTGATPLDLAQNEFPYRAPKLDARLDAALRPPLDRMRAERANDAAALLVLAAASEEATYPNAAVVALALLHRARGRAGACIPQLNLAFLVSADDRADDDDVSREFESAERLCPGDPTATWMLGQHRSRSAAVDEPQLTQRALATFRRLQRRPAGAALGLAGEADTELRLGYERDDRGEPFSARAHFQRALKLYRDAQRLTRDPGLAAGAARAHAGMGEFRAAAAQQRRAMAGRATFAPLAARHVEYLERGRRFEAAARAARPLIARHVFASGRALIAGEAFGDSEQDTGTPLSIGIDRLSPVTLEFAVTASPSPVGSGAPGGAGGGGLAAVTDVSFIPEFRPVDGVTPYDRWCPAWSLPRDLLLAGDPRAALAAFPGDDAEAIAGDGCASTTMVAAMAEFELGRPAQAIRRLRRAELDATLSNLREWRQDMWRFAGNPVKATAGARDWMRQAPRDPRVPDRLGEIAFLAKDQGTAARWFARSLRLIRSRPRRSAQMEADALLKRGTVLGFAGRRGEAMAVLERADEVATRTEAAAHAGARRDAVRNRQPPPAEEDVDDVSAVAASYHARAQSGDVLLRAGRYSAAAEAYDAAREREQRLDEAGVGDVLARREALYNNQAIAEAKLGRFDSAVASARDALAIDPRSPIFLVTSGYALRGAGKPAQAVRAYRGAVAADPRAHTAWNDLGAVLAGTGRLDDAVHAFQRSLGARDDYPLAWFNLGVAQGRRGIAHMLASQGAYGRAFGLDDGLRDLERDVITDDAIVFTDLDLSKPLPPQWSYAASQERAPVTAAGILLLVLLGLRLGRTLLARSFGGSLAGKLMEPMMMLLERFKRVPQYTPALVAVLATVAVFGAGLLRGGTGRDDAVVLLAGVLVLTAIVVRGRVLLARDGAVTLGQRGWTPGIALGAVVAAFGSAWAPLPVAEPSDPAPAVHWVGPVLTGLAALGLLVFAAWLSTPGTIALASVAIVMTASLLTPTKPLDGGFVASGTAGVAAGLALLGAGLFFVLGVG